MIPTRSHSTRSRQSRPTDLHRIFSGSHINDAGVYHDHDQDASDDESSHHSVTQLESSDSSNQYREKDEEEREEEEVEEVAEVRGGIPDIRDVEKGKPDLKRSGTNRSTRSTRSKKDQDPNLVAWDGPDDPANPKNWSMKRKWAATVIVSSFTFISPVSSSMVAPALGAMSADLGVTNQVVQELMLSIFILAYAVGPLILGPLSEIFGRVPVLQFANLFYLVFNLACGFAQTGPQMLVFRFLSGLGGSAPLAIGGGVLG